MSWACVALPKWDQYENRRVQLHLGLKQCTTALRVLFQYDDDCVGCLYIKPLCLPNYISIPSVRPDSLS